MVMPQGRAGFGGRGRGRGNPRPQVPLNDRIVNVPKSSIRKVQSIEGIDLTNKVVSCSCHLLSLSCIFTNGTRPCSTIVFQTSRWIVSYFRDV